VASYSTAVLDDIRAAVDIVELVGRFVNLRKAGANWKGLCPFHGEKTPSFMVNPQKGIFHCFGCGVGGDVFGFLMRQDRLSFPEAVRALARTAGVALPEERGTSADASSRGELLRIAELAAEFYSEALWKRGGEKAREYLDKRHVDHAIARRFRLGYAAFDGKWDSLLSFMKTHHFDGDALVAAGLAVKRESRDGFYDRFRDRLLFPIRDLDGKVVAFGGRAFGDEQPKYLNSPESLLYSKGSIVYAADVARDSIREKKRVIVVEGYVDCLAAHQFGFTETVAALGTAFTSSQLNVLQRYCDDGDIITFFDADSAGQKAAERAESLIGSNSASLTWAINRAGDALSSRTSRVKVALLPSGHDPDTFLRAEGAEAFQSRINQSRGILFYLLDRTIAAEDDSPSSRKSAFARVSLFLSKVPDAQEAAELSYEAARRLGVDSTHLWIQAQRLQDSLQRRDRPAGTATVTGPALTGEERKLVALLLGSLDAREKLLPLVEATDIANTAAQEIIGVLKENPALSPATVITQLRTEASQNLLSSLIVDETDTQDSESTIYQFEKRLEFSRRRKRVRELSRSMAEAQATKGSDPSLDGDLLAIQLDSARVYQFTGGSAQAVDHSHPTGPEGPQGVQAHE
jgi:DNA primase